MRFLRCNLLVIGQGGAFWMGVHFRRDNCHTQTHPPPNLHPPVRFSLTTNGPPVRYCALPSKMAALDTHSDRFPTTFHFWLLSAQLRFSNVCYTASWCLIFTTDHFCTPFSHIPTHLHDSLLYNLRNFLSYLAIVCYTVI